MTGTRILRLALILSIRLAWAQAPANGSIAGGAVSEGAVEVRRAAQDVHQKTLVFQVKQAETTILSRTT